MNAHNVARSLVISPIVRNASRSMMGLSTLSRLSGLSRSRIVDILNEGASDPTLDEVARLAASVGLEISVVPEDCGVQAFIEVENHPMTKDASSFLPRVVNMIYKVADLCVDIRLSTDLPGPVFEKRFKVDPGLMILLADNSSAGTVKMSALHDYMASFGLSLASFPKDSLYTSYYRALASLETETLVQPIATKLRVA